MARPAHYRPEFANQAYHACRLGADNAALARFFSVSPATLYRWLHQHPAFAAAADAGRALLDGPTPSSTFQRATGYDYQAERLFMRRGKAPVAVTYRRRVHAHPKAAFRWLRSRRPDIWRIPARPQPEQSNMPLASSAIPAATPAKPKAKSIDSHNSTAMNIIINLRKSAAFREKFILLMSEYIKLCHEIRQSQATAAKNHPHVAPQKSPSTVATTCQQLADTSATPAYTPPPARPHAKTTPRLRITSQKASPQRDSRLDDRHELRRRQAGAAHQRPVDIPSAE